MAFGTSDDAEWLLQSPTAGVSDGPDDEVEIAVSVDVSGLEVGSYSAAIEISGGGIQNSPRSVPVTLTVRSTGYVRQLVSQDEQTEIVTPDSTVRLIVPENAVSSDVDIRVERLEVDSQPEPPGEWERVVLAFELDTLTPGGATRRPTTYNPGVELWLLLPEDDAGACAAGRVDVYRVVSGQWRSLEHQLRDRRGRPRLGGIGADALQHLRVGHRRRPARGYDLLVGLQHTLVDGFADLRQPGRRLQHAARMAGRRAQALARPVLPVNRNAR